MNRMSCAVGVAGDSGHVALPGLDSSEPWTTSCEEVRATKEGTSWLVAYTAILRELTRLANVSRVTEAVFVLGVSFGDGEHGKARSEHGVDFFLRPSGDIRVLQKQNSQNKLGLFGV
jgi:hypothetical protein